MEIFLEIIPTPGRTGTFPTLASGIAADTTNNSATTSSLLFPSPRKSAINRQGSKCTPDATVTQIQTDVTPEKRKFLQTDVLSDVCLTIVVGEA